MTRIAAALAAMLFAFSVSAQEFRLRAGHDQPVGSMYDEGHQMFKKLVEERSKGRIRVDVFPAAQLGSEVAMVEGLRLGSIDVICANAPNAAAFIPELALFSVAYLFKDLAHFERVVNDPKFTQKVEEIIESNKHYEAAKFVSQTEHQRNLSALYINHKKLASLPADLQQMVLQAGKE